LTDLPPTGRSGCYRGCYPFRPPAWQGQRFGV